MASASRSARSALRITSWRSSKVTDWIGIRLDIPVVSLDELLQLWNENRMTEKRQARLFTEIVAFSVPARDPRLAAATSVIIKLLTPRGRHIGTVHEVVFSDGR